MPPVARASRQSRADRTRAHIIDTAAVAFAEHGLDGVSLNDIVRASRVSKGAFYFHFPSKEQLALATFRSKQEELIGLLLAGPLPESAIERVRVLLRRRVALIREDPSLFCVTRLGSELNLRWGPGSTYASFQDIALDLITGVVRGGQLSGEFSSELDAEATARVIYAALLGIDVLSLLLSGGKDLEQRSDELTELILGALVQRAGE